MFIVITVFRVINAGKSALNEDQACCEVVELRKRPADPASPSYTPTTRRRASLPTKEHLESTTEDPLIQESSVSGLSSLVPLVLHFVSCSMQQIYQYFFFHFKLFLPTIWEDLHDALINRQLCICPIIIIIT